MRTHKKLLGAALGATLGLAGFMNSAAAVPVVVGGPVDDSVFSAAGLDGVWNFVSPEIFGTGGGGNGFFSTGGDANFVLRLATYQHAFGTALTSHGGLTEIFNTNTDNVGDTQSFAAPANPFLFYFETLPCGGLLGCTSDDGRIFSDDYRQNDELNQLDMAIYQQGGTFAFFFDDAGPSGLEGCGKFCIGPKDDDDFNDMVVTVSAAVPEPATLGLLGAGLLALGLRARRRKVA